MSRDVRHVHSVACPSRARRDGVPPCLICTNKQLAEMVSSRPESMHKLGAIDGIGKAKLENYG